MANRSMLFAIDASPDIEVSPWNLIGLGEAAYEIPAIYQVLVSVRPQLCRSAIFDPEEPAAILGDAAGGLRRLKSVRDRLHGSAKMLAAVAEAIRWLDKPHHQLGFNLLEPAEVFDMDEEPEQSLANLFSKVATASDETFAAEIAAESHSGALASYRWSNDLYYRPVGTIAPPVDSDTISVFAKPAALKTSKDALPTAAALEDIYLDCSTSQADLAEVLMELERLPNRYTLHLKGIRGALPDALGRLQRMSGLAPNGLGLKTLPASICTTTN